MARMALGIHLRGEEQMVGIHRPTTNTERCATGAGDEEVGRARYWSSESSITAAAIVREGHADFASKTRLRAKSGTETVSRQYILSCIRSIIDICYVAEESECEWGEIV
jgi:hypothetical protein